MAKESLKQRLDAVKDRSTLRLTTIGRKTGKRHTVTVWFLVDGETVYLATLKLLRDWPRNVLKNGHVELNVADEVLKGRAKRITDAKRLAHVKTLLAKKYWAAWLAWVPACVTRPVPEQSSRRTCHEFGAYVGPPPSGLVQRPLSSLRGPWRESRRG